jgi:hypothetical protein
LQRCWLSNKWTAIRSKKFFLGVTP